MTGSVSFDRAAGYYDETRSLPPETAARQTDVLERALDGRAPVLEIGVGTGRISLPLHERGVPLVGVDLSSEMLKVLVGKSGGERFPLAIGDATRLPFRDGAFQAVLASHVLHLVADLGRTLDEVVRVLGPGGAFVLDMGGPGADRTWWREARRRFADAAGIERRRDGSELRRRVDDELRARGWTPRELEPITRTSESTPEEMIGRLERGLYSFTWDASEGQRRRGADAVRAWVREEMGSTTEALPVTHTIRWRAYERRS